MKVIFIVNDSGVYGANLSLINMIRSFDFTDCLVLVPAKGPLLSLLEQMSISYLIIPFRYNSAIYDNNLLTCFLYAVRFCYYWILNKYSYFRILKVVNGKKVHFIHTNDNRVSIGFEVSKGTGIKHIWHMREFLDLDYNMRPFKSFEKLCEDFNVSDSVICVSEAVKKHFHIQNKNVQVIYNAVESIHNLHNTKVKKERYFLFCGSLSEKKGVFDAIYSFSKMLKGQNLQLYIAGTGPTYIVKKIEAIIQQENLQGKVVLLGYRTDSKELMRKAIALLMCSKHEAFGRVTAEAMLSDCLVIGRNSGGTSELIEHGITGFLFNTNDELAKYMEKVLEMDTTDIRNKAKEKAIHSFTEEVYAERLKNVYESLKRKNDL